MCALYRAGEVLAWPVKKLILGLLVVYRAAISPLLGPHCRFYPSCSEYLDEALTAHGLLRGLFLGLIRLSKCHPWNEGGYDPVPDRSRPRQSCCTDTQ